MKNERFNKKECDNYFMDKKLRLVHRVPKSGTKILYKRKEVWGNKTYKTSGPTFTLFYTLAQYYGVDLDISIEQK